ncbi:MAG: hypothetical protein WAM97_00955 [Acidimicrobiales bacterium]
MTTINVEREALLDQRAGVLARQEADAISERFGISVDDAIGS